MKIDGLSHPKTKDFAIRLGVPIPHAVGLLEFFWYFTGKQTPRGNIGKWSNGVIACESQWTGDADLFIECLVSSGFLDRCETHRLVVHDWTDHAPRWVFAKLKKAGKEIISADLSADLSEDSRGRYKGSEVKGSEGKSRQGKGKTKVGPAKKRGPDRSAETKEVFAYWQEKLNHPQSKLDAKRDKAVKARLKDGYSVDELKAAIDGCLKSPHHMGENDRGMVYDDLELICRSAGHVDKFIKLASKPNLRAVSSAARQTAAAADEWLRAGGKS